MKLVKIYSLQAVNLWRQLIHWQEFLQIGAKLKFNKSVEEDKFLQEFQTIYNRMYSRYYRIDAWDSERLTNKLSEEEFKQWSYLASQLRLSYKEGNITGEQMIEVLYKSTEYEKE